MGESKTSAKKNTQTNLDGGGPGGSPSGKAGKVNVGRVAVLLAGLAVLFIVGLVLWLGPTGPTGATENTTTTVIDGTGNKSTTMVKKNTASSTPRVTDVMLVAVFTVGVGLLVVGGLWDQIREFSFGGISIKLTEAAVEQQEIPLAAASVGSLNSLDFYAPGAIAEELRKLPGDLRLARIDLQDGTFWSPKNLKWYVLLLANRSNVKVLIFTGEEDSQPERYLGAAPVAWLADKVKLKDPILFAAYQGTEHLPLWSEQDAVKLGETFNNSFTAPPDGPPGVSPRCLRAFADKALITQSIEVDVGQALSRQERLDILAFPLGFVPITNHRRHLEAVLDKRRIAKTLGFSAVDL